MFGNLSVLCHEASFSVSPLPCLRDGAGSLRRPFDQMPSLREGLRGGHAGWFATACAAQSADSTSGRRFARPGVAAVYAATASGNATLAAAGRGFRVDTGASIASVAV